MKKRTIGLAVLAAALVVEHAEEALEDLNNPDLQQALAEKAIADARKAVKGMARIMPRMPPSAGPSGCSG